MFLDEGFQHGGDFVPVVQVVGGDGLSGQALETGVLKWVHLAVVEHCQQVHRPLQVLVPAVDVGVVVQQKRHDLKKHVA